MLDCYGAPSTFSEFLEMPRLFFVSQQMQYESPTSCASDFCIDPIGFFRTAAASNMENQCSKSMLRT